MEPGSRRSVSILTKGAVAPTSGHDLFMVLLSPRAFDRIQSLVVSGRNELWTIEAEG